MGNFDKFKLLLWKCYLVQLRHPVRTCFEILIPILLFGLLGILKTGKGPVKNGPEFFPNYNPIHMTTTNIKYVAYSPTNPTLERLVKAAASELGIQSVLAFHSSKIMVSSIKDNSDDKNDILAGIQFDDNLAGDVALHKKMRIALRFPPGLRYPVTSEIGAVTLWYTTLTFPIFPQPGPREPQSVYTATPKYYEECFLGLQLAITNNIIKHFGGEVPNVTMQRYPYPEWLQDPLLFMLKELLPTWVLLSFMYNFLSATGALALEKELKLKEVLNIMGLSNWLQWTVWFIKTLSFLSISLAIIIFFLKWGGFSRQHYSLLMWSNGFILFLFLFLYLCASITFSFMISVFFSKAKTATLVASLFWLFSYIPYTLLQGSNNNLAKILVCVLSNSAMAFGIRLICDFEISGEGMQWNNIWRSPTPVDKFCLGYLMIALIIDAILYLVIALYVQSVFPGEYGIPKVWYFPCTPQFWHKESSFKEQAAQTDTNQKHSTYFEREPKNLAIGVQIQHLQKSFGGKTAVKDLSLNMYEGQVTVLLGHNGAGKSTTMFMLTGIYPPSGGTAVIAGHDIYTGMGKIRESLGFCPQHNILFQELTVKEHLYFYSRAKGLTRTQTKAEVEKYLEVLKLQDQKSKRASTLSGGMQRKLSLAVAMCGSPKIVLLDEPSAGVDPSTRRALWDLLLSQKKGKTILLTTHFMDEADLLGDRIAILVNGKLRCSGSSFFLKKQFGSGYHLIIEKGPDCNPQNVTKILQNYIPNTQYESNVGSQLSYCLGEEHSRVFEKLLDELESKRDVLHIQSFGVSLTTLEEVFMRMGRDDKDEDDEGSTISVTNEVTQVTGLSLYKYQFLAMFLKKKHCTLRSWKVLLLQIVIPLLLVLINLINHSTTVTNPTGGLPELRFTLDSYSSPITVVSGNNVYKSTYLKLLSESNHEYIDWKSNDFSARMLKETEEHKHDVRNRYIISATFIGDGSMIVWFNNEPYHSPGLALAMVLKCIAIHQLGTAYDIEISNYPLPYSTKQIKNAENMEINRNQPLYMLIVEAMTISASLYVLFYVRERVTKFKHLQFASGVNAWIFWATSLLLDYLSFVIISLLVVILVACFQVEGLRTFQQLGRLFLILLCFGYAVLPFEILVSFWFRVPTTCLAVTIFIGVVLGQIIGTIMYTLLTDGNKIATKLNWMFMLFPHYDLIMSLFFIDQKLTDYESCKVAVHVCQMITKESAGMCWELQCQNNPMCCGENYLNWELPGIGRFLLFQLIVGTILFLLFILVDFHILKYITFPCISPKTGTEEDDDVFKEKQRIQTMGKEELKAYTLVLKNVTKYYCRFLAVKNISVSVRQKECFGLLGSNGAGKTTLFKIMTGDMAMTSGQMYVDGINRNWNIPKIHKRISYCPQFDALMDELTGRETMTIFCLIRGIHRRSCDVVAEIFAKKLNFTKHLDKKVKTYSGGTKRKINTVLALIGTPTTVFLDEPTTGMDPGAKRCVWDVLCKFRDLGASIVLTSHSMDECEALCTRLAVMVNGEFKCLGSIQHLKSKFAKGYTLVVKIKRPSDIKEGAAVDTTQARNFVKEKFPSAKLKEERDEMLTFDIEVASKSLGKMFGVMEKAKTTLNIEDYSIGQSNLEQVFLRFTRQQTGGKDKNVHEKKEDTTKRKF